MYTNVVSGLCIKFLYYTAIDATYTVLYTVYCGLYDARHSPWYLSHQLYLSGVSAGSNDMV
jgi:hypothetical protein